MARPWSNFYVPSPEYPPQHMYRQPQLMCPLPPQHMYPLPPQHMYPLPPQLVYPQLPQLMCPLPPQLMHFQPQHLPTHLDAEISFMAQAGPPTEPVSSPPVLPLIRKPFRPSVRKPLRISVPKPSPLATKPSPLATKRLRPFTPDLTNCQRTIAWQCSDDKFEVQLDVKHFEYSELSVKVIGNKFVAHGHKEEPADGQDIQFTHEYVIPPGVESCKCESSHSPLGILTISAPMWKRPSENANAIDLKEALTALREQQLAVDDA